MRYLRFLSALLIFSVVFTACNSEDQPQSAIPPAGTAPIITPEDDYWAKDNFDLQRAGHLLERADSPEEFERYLNDDEYGVNNLDLNGDNYADYISVEEIEGRDDDSRGLSLFSRFGPDLIQQIATIFLYRDRPNYPGSRIMLVGDDNIYGDNHYYETNWLDRSLPIASYFFNDHNRYVSPYYYDNYPSWYDPYSVVETPMYRTRVAELYPQPAFVYTNSVPTYYSDIEIKSPYDGKWMEKVHAKMAKPRKEQELFMKNNPARRTFAKGDVKPGRVDPPRSDRGDERGNPGRDERGAQRGNPDRPMTGNPNKGSDRPAGRPDNPGGGNPNKGGGNPNKGGGNPNAGGNPNKGGGNPNKGGGNPNKGGGGNPNKGGGGKGGGKGKP